MIFLSNLSTTLDGLGQKTPYLALVNQAGQDYLIPTGKKSRQTLLERIHQSWCSSQKGSLGYLIEDEIFLAKNLVHDASKASLALTSIRNKITIALNKICTRIENKKQSFYIRLKQLLAKIFPVFFKREPRAILREKINILKGMQNRLNELMQQ